MSTYGNNNNNRQSSPYHTNNNNVDKTVLQQYQFEDTIGQGNFGKVKKATFLPTKETYAVKILNKKQILQKNEMHLIQRELNIIRHFNHLNVIYVHQIIEDDANYYIIMDYCENGELFDYIVSHKKLCEDEAAFLFYQIINGIDYIHSKHIVHRDLKPENLLLTSNKTLKIIDFGLSSFLGGDSLLVTKCGSPSYAAPEIINGNPYDGFKTDVWCCGIILYAMLCGYLPFEGKDNYELFKVILKSKLVFPSHISKICEGLIREMLHPNPDKRITLSELKTRTFYLKGKEYGAQLSKKKKKKIKGLHVLNSNSELNTLKHKVNLLIGKTKSNNNTKQKLFSPLKCESIASKIGNILKTDASLHHNFKAIGLGNCLSTNDGALDNSPNNHKEIITKENMKMLLLRRLKPKYPLKQIIENRLVKQELLLDDIICSKPNKKKYMITFEAHKKLFSPHSITSNNSQLNSNLQTRCNSCKESPKEYNNRTNVSCVMIKGKERGLSTEPKDFNELLKANYTKFINNKTSLTKKKTLNKIELLSDNNKKRSKVVLSTMSSVRVTSQSKSKSKEKLFSSDKKKNHFPKLMT